jgi:hypothetical protein
MSSSPLKSPHINHSPNGRDQDSDAVGYHSAVHSIQEISIKLMLYRYFAKEYGLGSFQYLTAFSALSISGSSTTISDWHE